MRWLRKWWLAGGVLALLMSLNWWINRGIEQQTEPLAKPDQPIDYALYDFRARFRDEAGETTVIVHGPKLQHDATTRRATIDDPEFEIAPNRQGWNGRADIGVIERDAKRLELHGAVRLHKPDPRGQLTIATETLHYDHAAGTAHSPVPARITQAGTELTGGTLTVWMDDEKMELDHDVRAIYRAGGNAAGAATGNGSGPH